MKLGLLFKKKNLAGLVYYFDVDRTFQKVKKNILIQVTNKIKVISRSAGRYVLDYTGFIVKIIVCNVSDSNYDDESISRFRSFNKNLATSCSYYWTIESCECNFAT